MRPIRRAAHSAERVAACPERRGNAPPFYPELGCRPALVGAADASDLTGDWHMDCCHSCR